MEYSTEATEKTVVNGGNIRELLCKNGFYNEYKLSKLIDSFRMNPSLNTAISSINIDPYSRFVEIRFRQNYLDKHDILFYNEPMIIDAIHNWYLDNSDELISIIKDSSIIYQKNHLYSSMYYYLSKLGNSLFINFM